MMILMQTSRLLDELRSGIEETKSHMDHIIILLQGVKAATLVNMPDDQGANVSRKTTKET